MKTSWITLLACLIMVGGSNLVTSTGMAFEPGAVQETEKKKDAKKDGKKTVAATPIIANTKVVDDDTKGDDLTPAATAFNECQAKFNDATKKFRSAYSEATSKKASQTELRALVNELYPKPADYVQKFMEIAKEFPESPEAVKSLIWVATNDRGPASKKALDSLMSDHIKAEGLGQICGLLSRALPSADSLAQFDRLIDGSPHHDVVGNAVFSKAQYLVQIKTYKERVAENEAMAKRVGEEAASFLAGFECDEADIEALYQRVVDEFSDVGEGRFALKKRAEGSLFEMRYLAIGKTAPEIEGSDFDGEEFKLSDYRGKVVVIDFWGDW